MSTSELKKAVGYKAASFVESGMRVGLGSGSTTHFFIEKLGMRCQEGLQVTAIASSLSSMALARKWGIPLLDPCHVQHLDLTVDGADEIDPQKRMTKGGGGALVREKIVASISSQVIIIVDASKCVPHLGRAKLPVEILPFAYLSTLHRIEHLGYTGELRLNPDKSPLVTDNGNYIFDIFFTAPRLFPEEDHEALIHLPGVIDTGFFFHLAHRVLVGYPNGEVAEL